MMALPASVVDSFAIPARSRVGRIHSLESLGAVDGPGLRCVIFTQGCLMRCRYCHNPDTWDLADGKETTVASLVGELKGYLPFMKASRGGVTVSGGEPLLQAPFVAGLFAECHKLGIHTALDTNGYSTAENARPVLEHTDLVLLDIKHMDPEKHKQLTAVERQRTLDFARLCSEMQVPMWIRYVVVPGVTDGVADVEALGDFVAWLPGVQKVELLPYHLLGRHKWEKLGLTYTLDGVEPPSGETMRRITKQLSDRGLVVG
ncbi:MAG TPA: pyruvate formate-lyase-activating protein [Symbiobacteriaceae bacterium]|nr:pyruvate formate-lyase-activating protein [Symbiobacteriaceae bacterium]